MFLARILVVIGAVLTIPGSGGQHWPDPRSLEYSAEVVLTLNVPSGPWTHTTHVYVSKGRMRWVAEERGTTQVVLYDTEKGKAWSLVPERKVAFVMDLRDVAKDPQKASEAIAALLSFNPCLPQFAPEITCERLGADTVDGRRATKWLVSGHDGPTRVVWIDDALGVRLRTEDRGGVVEMKNLIICPQPADFFEVPADYKVEPLPHMPHRPKAPDSEE